MAFEFITDPFEGETVDPYKPKKENFEYGGLKEGYFSGGAKDAQQRGYGAELERLGQSYGDVRSYDAGALGRAQLKAGQEANMRQALALARSGRGGAGAQAAALQQAQSQNAMAGQQTNLQAAQISEQARMQQLALQGQLAGQYGQLGMQGRGLNDQYALGMYGLGQKSSLAQLQANMGYEQLMSQNSMAAQMANAQMDAQRDASLVGLVGTAAAAGIAASDIRAKQDIAPLSYGGGGGGMSYAEREDLADAQKRGQVADIVGSGVGAAAQTLGNVDLMQYAPQQYQAPQFVDSDRRAKEAEQKVSALETALQAVGGGRPAQLQRMPVPGRSPEYANEAEFQRAAVQEYNRNRAALEAERKYQEEQAVRQAKAEREARALRALAEYERDRGMAEDARRGGALQRYGDRYQPAYPQGPMPAGVPSDKRSKEYISALETALANVRDEQVSGIRGVPTKRFEDVSPVVQDAADVPAYGFRYNSKFAPTYGSEYRFGRPMAQDMERSAVYAPSVKTGPDGYKRVDTGEATMANVGVTSELSRIVEDQDERLRRVEKLAPFTKPKGY